MLKKEYTKYVSLRFFVSEIHFLALQTVCSSVIAPPPTSAFYSVVNGLLYDPPRPKHILDGRVHTVDPGILG